MNKEEKLKATENLSEIEWARLLLSPDICTRCMNHHKIKDECKLNCKGDSCCKKGITEYIKNGTKTNSN